MSAAYNEFCLRIVSEFVVPFSGQDAFFGQTFVAEKLFDLTNSQTANKIELECT